MEESEFSTPATGKSTAPRQRKTWSLVWNDFTKERLPDGTTVATCHHCKRQLTASSRSGTTHLKNHLITCTSERRPDGRKLKRRKLIVRRPFPLPSDDSPAKPDQPPNFDQEQSRQDLAHMILLHQYPFTIVEDAGFKTFLRNLQPHFRLPPSDSVKADCLAVYESERAKLREALGKVTSRVSVTVDTRGGGIGDEYLCLTCHYVDNDWKLRKKILSLASFDPLSTPEDVGAVIIDKLCDWDIHQRLSSVVLDNISLGDDVAKELLDFARSKGALILNGGLFHLQSYGHILNLIVQDGLTHVAGVVDRVRESVKYVRSSPQVIRRFQDVAKLVHAPQKPLLLDDPASWTSTYGMLAVACEFQDAFLRLAECAGECPHLLSFSEWDDVKAINECLDVCYQLMKKFSSFTNPTANLYFVDICGIHLLLRSWCTSQIPVVVLMGSHMFKIFEHCWGMTRMIMAVASVLDPRYKMKSIEYFFKHIYSADYEAATRIEDIQKGLTNIYNEYEVHANHTSSNQGLLCFPGNDSGCNSSPHGTDGVVKITSRITLTEARKGFDQYLQESSSSQSIKTDLDLYLEEAVHPYKEGDGDNFDVLAWWKVNAPKYPILSLMARDILATPMSSIPLEMEGKAPLHPYMDSMDPTTLQSLICARDWLRDEGEATNSSSIMCVANTSADELHPLL